jgi:hypothetical protein
MKTILIVAPLLVGIIILLYTIIANLLRVWLDHRIKLALLEKLQHDPHAPATAEELRALLDEHSVDAERKPHVDYVIVGAALSFIGFCTALAAYILGHGQSSAGVYFGGVVCVAVGGILALLGLLIRYLKRLPIDSELK